MLWRGGRGARLRGMWGLGCGGGGILRGCRFGRARCRSCRICLFVGGTWWGQLGVLMSSFVVLGLAGVWSCDSYV